MIRRLKLFWKLSLIAALIPISVGAGMAVSLHGARQLEADYDTRYGFMRTSIQMLDEADTRREALEGHLQELAQPDLSPERRMLLVQRIRENGRAMATLAQDKKEWLAGHESNTRAQEAIEWMVSRFLLMGLLLSLAGILVAWGLSRLIARPLEGLIRLTSGVSRGQLETLKGEAWARTDPYARDEVGTLLRTTWDMVTRWTEVSSEMHVTASELVETASTMSSHAQAVVSVATEHAAHIYDLWPSGLIHALHHSATEAAENCRGLEAVSHEGVCAVDSIQHCVSQTVAAMEAMVSKDSLIEELASQTNLLALKATTGLTCAGDHDRDFARVTHEVRKLGELCQTTVQGIRAQATSSMELAVRSAQALEDLWHFIKAFERDSRQVAGSLRGYVMCTSQLNLETSELAKTADRTVEASERLAAAAEQLVLGAQSMQQGTAGGTSSS